MGNQKARSKNTGSPPKGLLKDTSGPRGPSATTSGNPLRFSMAARHKKPDFFLAPDAIRSHRRTEGGHAVGSLLQTKLKIGQPNDKYEKEADRVADQVMRMSDTAIGERFTGSHGQGASLGNDGMGKAPVQTKPIPAQITPLVQRREAPEDEEPVQGWMVQRLEEEEPVQTRMIQRLEEEDEPVQARMVQRLEEEEEPVQARMAQRLEEEDDSVQKTGGALEDRKPISPGAAAARTIRAKGSGVPIEPATRELLEAGTGRDLGGVRVHGDGAARDAARDLKARAFTHGRDIWLGPGASQQDKSLMAHEATHVIQQTSPRLLEPPGQARTSAPAGGTTGGMVQKATDNTAGAPTTAARGATDGIDPGEMELKGMSGEFTPPSRIAGWIDGKVGKRGKVNVRFGKIARGPVDVRKTGNKYRIEKRQAITLNHPLFSGANGASRDSTPSLILHTEGGKLGGYIGLGASPPESFSTMIKKAPDRIGLAGFDLDKLPKVTNKLEAGRLHIGMTGVKFTLGGAFTGSFDLELIDEGLTFKGEANINVKGLADGKLALGRAENGLITGKTTVKLTLPKNFSGGLDVAWDGSVITGEGKVGYKGEKLSGDVTLKLMEKSKARALEQEQKAPGNKKTGADEKKKNGKKSKKNDYVLFGEGDLAFSFTDWLNGTAHVIVNPDGFVSIVGKITPQEEFELFPQKDYNKDLFEIEARASYGIPVVGNIFIFANVGMDAFAKVGPAKLYKIVVAGAYSTDPKKSGNFSIQGILNISAAAGLRLRGEAGAGLEVLAHDIKAGGGVNAMAEVRGYAEATPVIGYREGPAEKAEDKKGEFFIRGDVEIAAQPILGLNGDLFVEVDAPWWSPVPDKKWTWPMGDKEWPMGGSLGVGASIGYVFGSDKHPEVEFKEVDFSADKFMTDLYSDKAKSKSGGGDKKPGKWKEKNARDAEPPSKETKQGDAKAGKPAKLPPAQPKVEPGGAKKATRPADPKARTAEGKTVKEYQKEATRKGAKPAAKEPKGGSAKESRETKAKEKPEAAEQGGSRKWVRGVKVVKDALSYAEKEGVTLKELNRILKSIKKQKKFGFSKLYAKDDGEKWHVYGGMSLDKKVTEAKKKQLADLEEELWRTAPRQEYEYPTDGLQRPEGPFGHVPRSGGKDREKLPPKGKGYLKGDHRGHLIADRFDGEAKSENLVPMSPSLNLSKFKKFENQVAGEFKEAEEKKEKQGIPSIIYIEVRPEYSSDDESKELETYRPTGVKPIADVITQEGKGKQKKKKIRPGFMENEKSGPYEKVININYATIEELMSIPGIGRKTAENLRTALEYVEIARTTHLEKLKNYDGIGPNVIKILEERRKNNKLKYYEMEEVTE